MKINPVANPNILRNYQTARPISEANIVEVGRDEVTFSAEALNFSKVMAHAKETIELRTPEEQNHISNISNAIRQGEYRVDSEKVAEKILESVRGR